MEKKDRDESDDRADRVECSQRSRFELRFRASGHPAIRGVGQQGSQVGREPFVSTVPRTIKNALRAGPQAQLGASLR